MRPPVPLLPPKATPGPFETDGRRHGTMIEEAWNDFLGALELPKPAPPHFAADSGFSPLGMALDWENDDEQF